MLWFIVGIIFLILWLTEREKSKSIANKAYWEGVTEGRRIELANQKTQPETSASEHAPDYTPAPQPVAPESQPMATTVQPVASVAQPVVWQPAEPVSQQDIEAAKELRTVKNLNTLLYLGSFFIVAAMALFVNLTMPATAKLAGMIAVTLAFYLAGLILHANSKRLKSAAIAFVGTGLAILPFTGIALSSLGGMSGQTAWLITSMVGLIAYGVAAIRLQSQLISYITMASVLSLALSSVSTLGLSVLWYFIAVMAVSLLFNSVKVLFPTALPEVFQKPLQDTSLVTTPIALAASLFMINEMDLWMYEALFGLATAHYLIIWLQTKSLANESAVRVLGHFTLILVLWDLSSTYSSPKDKLVMFGLGWLLLATIQAAYSFIRVRVTDEKSHTRESIYIGAMILAISVIWPLWMGDDRFYYLLALEVGLIGLISGAAALRLRRVGWLYGLLASTLLLPLIIMRGAIEPALPYWSVVLVFASAGLISLAWLERVISVRGEGARSNFLSIATTLYGTMLILCGALSGDSLTVGWALLVGAGVFVGLSFVLSSAAVELLGAILITISAWAWVDLMKIETGWIVVTSVVLQLVVLAVGIALHQYYQQKQRRDYLAALAAMVPLQLLGVVIGYKEAQITSVILLLLGAVGMVVLRSRFVNSKTILGAMSVASYAVYPFLALMLATLLGAGWLSLVFAVIVGVLWAASYIELKPSLVAIGNLSFVAFVTSLWIWLDFSGVWMLHGIAWISAAVFYLIYWYAGSTYDTVRQKIALISTILALSLGSFLLFDYQNVMVIASAGSLLMLATVVGLHGWLRGNKSMVEAAVYLATFGLQRIVSVIIPDAHLVFYAHWWALTIGMMAFWAKDFTLRPKIALAIVTLFSGLFALAGEPGFSILFLIEHIIIVIIASTLRAQWAMWWGVGAVIASILYFLKGYGFAMLLFLGFLLILFVIWRLTRMGDKTNQDNQPKQY